MISENIPHIFQNRRNHHIISIIKAGRFPIFKEIFKPIFQFYLAVFQLLFTALLLPNVFCSRL